MFVAAGVAVAAGVKIVYESIRKPTLAEIVAKTLNDPKVQKRMKANIIAKNALLKRYATTATKGEVATGP